MRFHKERGCGDDAADAGNDDCMTGQAASLHILVEELSFVNVEDASFGNTLQTMFNEIHYECVIKTFQPTVCS